MTCATLEDDDSVPPSRLLTNSVSVLSMVNLCPRRRELGTRYGAYFVLHSRLWNVGEDLSLDHPVETTVVLAWVSFSWEDRSERNESSSSSCIERRVDQAVN